MIYTTLREFKTASFRVIVDACDDDDLDLSFDDDGQTRAGLDSGKYIAFQVRVRVIHSALGEVGADYLCGCIYESLDAFMDHKECGRYNKELAAKGEQLRCGSYFRDMIGEAISDARRHLNIAKTVRVRAA
jgi:hypothetical protein